MKALHIIETPARSFQKIRDTVECATTNDATTNDCYNEQFLTIKSGCYNELGGILFITESSIIAFTKERLYAFHVRWIVYAFY